jgi:hypothetical protein
MNTKHLEILIEAAFTLISVVTWICGVALALNGPGNSLIAFIFPPYAWVLFASAVLRHAGWIP